ncbi:Phosphate-regulating neutral endopeptidase [Aphelenchoides fujianensis]|nr:Phosphate-regulating neutral endopeptidase [Aphelenchoides fujianensis]
MASGGGKALKGILAILTLLIAIVILGISIATMVKVYSKPKTPNGNADSKGLSDKPNLMNVQPPAQISNQDADKFSAYQSYAKVLSDSVNTSFNPCDDFFMYTCGSFKGDMSFSEVESGNMKHVANSAKKDQALVTPHKSTVGKQAAYHFQKCKEAYKDPKIIHQDGKTITDIYNLFKKNAGIDFPLFSPGWSGGFPSADVFAKVVGVLSGQFQTETFVTFMIDTNWQHPADKGYRPYAVYVDQTTLTFSDTYYIKAWDVYKDSLKNASESILGDVAGFLNVQLDEAQMEKDLQAIFDMEVAIAKTINTDGNTRRNYSHMVHPYKIADANAAFPLLKFDTYLQEAMAFGSPDARNVVLKNPDYQININEPDQLGRLTTYLKTVDARTIYNYFFYRLLLGKAGFLPSAYKSIAHDWLRDDYAQLGRKKTNDRWKRVPRRHPDEVGADDSAVEYVCAEESANFLWYINARWFVDDLLPTDDQRDKLRSSVALVTAKVLEGFQNQLDQLSWMTSDTKKGAYDKITYLTRNMGYPSKITDDEWLDTYYKALKIDTNSDYLSVIDACIQFLTYDQLEHLTLTDQTIRDDFGGCPSIVNAWYQPEMNSITFPLGILQRPFFDVNYPTAINYGAFGVVAGHELTHGKPSILCLNLLDSMTRACSGTESGG